VTLFGMRALVVGGAMIAACQSASDARASRTADSAKASRSERAHRDSLSGFTVPAQCARGPVPLPKKLEAASTPAHGDSLKGDSVHVVGAWRDSTGGAVGSRGGAPSAATRADTTSASAHVAKPGSAKAARADSIARVRA
jgi:hypothetical protein